MNTKKISDADVEIEINALSNDPMVLLAKRAEQIKNRRRKYLYFLRNLKKKGEELNKAGITMEVLDKMDKACDTAEGVE